MITRPIWKIKLKHNFPLEIYFRKKCCNQGKTFYPNNRNKSNENCLFLLKLKIIWGPLHILACLSGNFRGPLTISRKIKFLSRDKTKSQAHESITISLTLCNMIKNKILSLILNTPPTHFGSRLKIAADFSFNSYYSNPITLPKRNIFIFHDRIPAPPLVCSINFPTLPPL